MRKVPIRFGNMGMALKWLGSLYRSSADALKEHVNNAIDEHIKARAEGTALAVCKVDFFIDKKKIVIDYPYGMSKKEFEEAIQSVADSAKKNLSIPQMGRFGIGMFSVFQFGKNASFFSRKNSDETIKVTIKEGSDEAEFETARKKESLKEPGIRIEISGFSPDIVRPRGPVSLEKLDKFFSEKFDFHLRSGSLKISLNQGGVSREVKPLEIGLPRIGKNFENWFVKGNHSKNISLELYFDPSGNGVVGVRHLGGVIVDNLKTISAYGLEETVFASGDVRGFIDADFLDPLPSRTGFQENSDWTAFLGELDVIRPMVEAEIDIFKEEGAKKKLTELQKKAIELASLVLNEKEFKDLEMLETKGERKLPELRMPPNGFDFIPESARVDPGKFGVIPLKVFVAQRVADGCIVNFSINRASVEIMPKRATLKATEADERGVVTVQVAFIGKHILLKPAILTALCGDLKAEARLRISDADRSREQKSARGINYEEKNFEDGSRRHSRYFSRIIQINKLNSDYKVAIDGTDEEKLAYAALMIGKEAIAFDDKSGGADDYLEKFLIFYFKMKGRIREFKKGARRPKK